jgi:hypothetical protein
MIAKKNIILEYWKKEKGLRGQAKILIPLVESKRDDTVFFEIWEAEHDTCVESHTSIVLSIVVVSPSLFRRVVHEI